jgi:short-subunit dehydrogenase
MSYWQGKRAVVTGGSAGLGRALARALAKHGARVAIVARGQLMLDDTANELRAAGAEVLTVTADVTNEGDVRRLASTIRTAWDGIDFLCPCAGRSMRGTALTTSVDDFRDLWETNFLSALRCSQVFAEALTASRGHLVLIGSLASKVAAGYLGAYPASKFPLAALAQQLRVEIGHLGIHVLLVCPGPIARNDGPRKSRPPLISLGAARRCGPLIRIGWPKRSFAHVRSAVPNWSCREEHACCSPFRSSGLGLAIG